MGERVSWEKDSTYARHGGRLPKRATISVIKTTMSTVLVPSEITLFQGFLGNFFLFCFFVGLAFFFFF